MRSTFAFEAFVDSTIRGSTLYIGGPIRNCPGAETNVQRVVRLDCNEEHILYTHVV